MGGELSELRDGAVRATRGEPGRADVLGDIRVDGGGISRSGANREGGTIGDEKAEGGREVGAGRD